jgi:hypothetical protein
MANAIRDILQSASNTAASNVSAPVDALAWALRKLGLDVGQPVGGSDWMAQRGLTKPVEPGWAQVVGDTLGLSAPIMAAAKAPEIAANLLKHGDQFQAYNQAAGPAGASQATVWHGSPHKFDAFDASKIGTGEGAQSYGHGLYLAESPDVAKSYQTTNVFRAFDIAPEAEKRGLQLSAGARGELIRQASANPDPMIAARRLQYAKASTRDIPQEKLADLIKGYQEAQSGAMYKVDLPDNAIAKMLDWDKPLSQQAPEVRAAVTKAMDPYGYGVGESMFKRSGNMSGGDWYRSFANQQLEATAKGGLPPSGYVANSKASELLRPAGIPGIRYLDGGSRGAGQGTSNYVVFPGNESLLTILERNGIKP